MPDTRPRGVCMAVVEYAPVEVLTEREQRARTEDARLRVAAKMGTSA